MTKATLNYVIKIGNEVKTLNLYSEPLYSIDQLTSLYMNDKDFISNYYDRDRIKQFVRENGNIEGNLSIEYPISIKEVERLPLLFNLKQKLYAVDNPFKGELTELEKARRLLFNSKNQLFANLVLSSKIIDKYLTTLIDLPPKTESIIYKYGLKTVFLKNKHYIRFRDLIRFRIKSRKLGPLREVYEDILNDIKNEINNLNDDNYYFYNRQFKLLIDEYNNHMSEISVKNLKIQSIRRIDKYRIVKAYR